MSIYDQILEEEKRLLESGKPSQEANPYQAILDEEAISLEQSNIKREYVEQGGRPEDVYSPERAKILVEQGPEALIAEPPLKREDGSIAGPTLPTEEALAKGLIEERAKPAVEQALKDGVNTVSSGFDKQKGVGFAVGRDKDGNVVRVEKEPEQNIYQQILEEEKKQTSSLPSIVPDEKLSPSQSAVARESLGRFAKGALVTGPAALARTYGLAESALGIPVQGEPYPFESTAGARIAQGIEQARRKALSHDPRGSRLLHSRGGRRTWASLHASDPWPSGQSGWGSGQRSSEGGGGWNGCGAGGWRRGSKGKPSRSQAGGGSDQRIP